MTSAADIADLAGRIPAPLRVRAATTDDLERVVSFQNRYARPAQVVSPALARRFEQRNPQPKRLVLVVEDEAGEVVAVGSISDGGIFAAPDGRFSLGLRVAPERRRRGIGAALLDRLERHAVEQGSPRIVGALRGDEPEGRTFSQRHGYREFHERINSYLDVPAFDASRFDDPDRVAERVGVRMVTYAEITAERAADLDAWQRELYDFGLRTMQDIPRPEPIPMPPYEAIRDVFYGPDGLQPEATIVALRDGRVVGSTLTNLNEAGIAYTWYTGVDRAERGKGLALAMKLRAIAALKRQGARLFGTTNDEANAPMRGINAKLGYVPDPPMIEIEKRLGSP